jgi:hypothetical protein
MQIRKPTPTVSVEEIREARRKAHDDKIKEIQNYTDDELIRIAWISHRHLDSQAFFLWPPGGRTKEWPNESIGIMFWNEDTPKLEEVKKLAIVYDAIRDGKLIERYYCPNYDSIKFILDTCKDEIEEVRKNLIKIENEIYEGLN